MGSKGNRIMTDTREWVQSGLDVTGIMDGDKMSASMGDFAAITEEAATPAEQALFIANLIGHLRQRDEYAHAQFLVGLSIAIAMEDKINAVMSAHGEPALPEMPEDGTI
jgi:hypothetical protein